MIRGLFFLRVRLFDRAQDAETLRTWGSSVLRPYIEIEIRLDDLLVFGVVAFAVDGRHSSARWPQVDRKLAAMMNRVAQAEV